VSNPFDDQDGVFVVLANDHHQYSIWPAAAEAPSGWFVVFEQSTREACVDYISTNWTCMRPRAGGGVRYLSMGAE
jgi:MbtH protein